MTTHSPFLSCFLEFAYLTNVLGHDQTPIGMVEKLRCTSEVNDLRLYYRDGLVSEHSVAVFLEEQLRTTSPASWYVKDYAVAGILTALEHRITPFTLEMMKGFAEKPKDSVFYPVSHAVGGFIYGQWKAAHLLPAGYL